MDSVSVTLKDISAAGGNVIVCNAHVYDIIASKALSQSSWVSRLSDKSNIHVRYGISGRTRSQDETNILTTTITHRSHSI